MNVHSAPVAASTPSGQRASFALAYRLAARELRGGVRGFGVFLGCIALGVAAIAAVNSVSASITGGISEQGREILGGDVAVSMMQLKPSDSERQYFASQGRTSEAVSLRAMARRADGSDQVLVELKAVDDAYPLVGELSGPQGPIDITSGDKDTAWADPLLFERLQLKQGDTILVGEKSFKLAGEIAREPDRIADGMIFGPRLLIRLGGLDGTGLLQPGSLYRSSTAIALADSSSNGLAQFRAQSAEQFKDKGWQIRSRDNAAPALARNIARFAQFLTLVGLASLVVGGVGVANSVRAFVERKRPVIATLKSVGASGDTVFMVYLLQVMALAAIGIAGGLVLGALSPYAARGALASLLPVSQGVLFFPSALLVATAFGLLTAFTFAVWPLAQAREVRPSELFRSAASGIGRLPAPIYLLMTVAGLAAMCGLALFISATKFVALVFIAGAAFAFAALWLVARAVQWAARAAPRPRSTILRMAIANIHRPNALAGPVILSLGLGLSLMVALALVDVSLRSQITSRLPQDTPDFFFLDIPRSQFEGFKADIDRLAPDGNLVAVPMMRGRVVSLKGIRSEDYLKQRGDGEGGWVLRGDRGVTYSDTLPDNSTLAEGEWWAPGHSGEALVSFSAEEARELGLTIGDRIEVSVLGRVIGARIANLRQVEWESMGINFVMVFSANAFAGAPHGFLATLITEADSGGNGEGVKKAANSENDGAIMREIAAKYPSVASVRVRDAIETVNGLISQLGVAVRAASAVAIVASLLVLAGALAAGNRNRIQDSVVLKTLGATRRTLISAFVAEFSLLGLAAGAFALAAGSVAAWFVTTQIMQIGFTFDPAIAVLVIGAALIFTVGLGLAGAWRILGLKAAPFLREL